MNGKHYVGKRISSLEMYDELGPVSGVALLLDDENEIFSGDESGYVLEMECPYATQEMADNILASVAGQTYKGFRAQDAKLPVDSELGDGVTVNGTYSLLAYQLVSFGSGHVSEIAAPGENTVDHEYPYVSPIQRQIQRNKSQAYSLISKTAEEIRLEVSEQFKTTNEGITETLKAYSTITQTAEAISTAVHEALYVEGSDGDGNTVYTEKYSTVTQTASDISAAVSETKEYSDGQLTTTLEKYSTTEQTTEKISSSIHEALYVEAETDVLPKTEYEFVAGGNQSSSLVFELEEGVHYYVDWGGVEYDCGTPTVNDYTSFITLALTTDAFSILCMYDTDMTLTTSRITPYADASYVRIFTRSTTEYTEKYSTVTQTAERISAAVYGLVNEDECQSMIDVSLGKIELVVSNNDDGTSCSIVMKTTTGDGDASSEIQISSADIVLDGLVTIASLGANGTTEIDGGRIKTGTIDAERINLTGAISFSDLSDYSTVNSRITTASNAASIASSAVTQIANGKYTGGTFIDGTNIYSPSIYGDTISLLDGDSNLVGTMSMVLSNTWAFDITSEMSVRLTAASGYNSHMGVSGGPSFTARGSDGCACIAGKMVVTSGSYGALSSRPTTGTAGQVYFAIS